MAFVEVLGLTKCFGAETAVAGIDFEVPEGHFVTLLGPSGCGKTTTLRCLAGLERPGAGDIVIGGECVVSPERGIWVPPKQRNLGMVFQSYSGGLCWALRHPALRRTATACGAGPGSGLQPARAPLR